MVFGINKKKEENKPTSDVPVQAVISMKDRGMTNEQIIEQLKSQGYSLQAIRDSLTQAEVKKNAISQAPIPPEPPKPPANEMPELPPLPGANNQPQPIKEPEQEEAITSPVRSGPGLNTTQSMNIKPSVKDVKIDEIERILEEIVDERWKDVTKKVNDIENSRIKDETRINELSKRISEVTSRVDEMSSVVMSKVEEYKKTMSDVDIEIKALEKVMQKLVPSMAEQVKELKDVVSGLKGVKPLEDS